MKQKVLLTRGGRGEVIQVFNAKISPNYFVYFYKGKMYCYIIGEKVK